MVGRVACLPAGCAAGHLSDVSHAGGAGRGLPEKLDVRVGLGLAGFEVEQETLPGV